MTAIDRTRPPAPRRGPAGAALAGGPRRAAQDVRHPIGFWLMASIVIAGLIATVATIAFAPDADLTYYTFAKAIRFPMTVVLPMIAILSITGEWSQRSA